MRITYNWKNILLGLLALALLCGEAIGTKNIRFAGVVLTGYRVFIISNTIVCIFILIKRKISVNYLFFFYMSYGFFWIVYTMFQIFTTENLLIINSIKIIFSLVLGFLSIFCINVLIDNYKLKEKFVFYMTIITYVLILIGIIEIITGHHLPISRLNDLQALEREKELWNINIEEKFYIATGSCYNENDFSSIIAMMIPVFFIITKSNLQKLIAVFMSFLGITIILINGSLIPLIALLAGVSFYLFLRNNKLFKLFFTFSIIILLLYISCSGILETILNTSSFARRNILYKESFKLALKFGKSGLGPSGFQTYFLSHPNNSLVSDPHNLIFELWVQYGIITLVVFILSFIFIYNSVFKSYSTEKKKETLFILVLLLMYWIISFSSSSFLDKALAYWPIGLAFLYTERTEVILKKKKYAN